MFTGMIEEVGTVKKLVRGTNSAVVTIISNVVIEGSRVGDSVAVNGACLTVIDISGGAFSADIMHETLARTCFSDMRIGARVNLERAMPSNGRFGGHIVTGHVDGMGVVSNIRRDGNAVLYTVRASEAILRYIVRKGSVAIDGVSLTVARVGGGCFSVSVIPHTQDNTALGFIRVGEAVNIECDVIGKYIEKFIGTNSGVTRAFLADNGFTEGL